MNSCACAALCRRLDLRLASHRGRPYAMFAAIVSSNSTVSCVTMPICDRSDASVTSRMSTPSIQDRPARDVVEPRHQIDERRLAGAASADDGEHLALPER